MNIILGDFQIKNSEGIARFDVYTKRTFQSGKRKGEIVWDAEFFGMSMERCVQVIIQEMTDRKTAGDVDFPTFLKEYERISKETILSLSKILKK